MINKSREVFNEDVRIAGLRRLQHRPAAAARQAADGELRGWHNQLRRQLLLPASSDQLEAAAKWDAGGGENVNRFLNGSLADERMKSVNEYIKQLDYNKTQGEPNSQLR